VLPRELYLSAPGNDTALWCSVSYTDQKLKREEIHRTSGESDAYHNFQRRVSRDNGKTWSDLQMLPDVTSQLEGGGIVNYPGGYHFDPVLGNSYQMKMRRIWPGMEIYTFNWGGHAHPFNDHVFVIENDEKEVLLRYENGPVFDQENPFDPEFCASNCAYFGVAMDFASDGTAYFPIVCHTAKDDTAHTSGGIVLMRRDPASGEWLTSNQQYLSPERTSRGLLEPDVAVLKNGNILTVARGNDTPACPGRKWFSLSTDGGETLSPVEEFRYDDGSSFYSPSSIHCFQRSSKNGKLYWLANITPEPPEGSGPRYPLYIAEIDETNVAVRKDSLIEVDVRGDDEPNVLQLSNFSVIENRETLDIEIYLTRLGEDPEHFWHAPVYRYSFSPA
jgi:hypothetical protein